MKWLLAESLRTSGVVAHSSPWRSFTHVQTASSLYSLWGWRFRPSSTTLDVCVALPSRFPALLWIPYSPIYDVFSLLRRVYGCTQLFLATGMLRVCCGVVRLFLGVTQLRLCTCTCTPLQRSSFFDSFGSVVSMTVHFFFRCCSHSGSF